MRKYIGTSIISQKKKNRNMSMARNTPITPPRIHSRFRWKKPMRRWISFQEQRTDSTPSRPVRATISSDRPSIARWMLMPKRSIHGSWNSVVHCGSAPGTGASWKFPVCHSQRLRTRVRVIDSSAIQRGRTLLEDSAIQQRKPPIKGIRISQGRIMTGSFSP
ncbi:hypothetical protein D9M69_476310 [compost metagenome]